MAVSEWTNTQYPDEQNSSDTISVTPSLSRDEQQKLIQTQLIILLHASKCQMQESPSVDGAEQCFLPHCPTMKNVLRHIATCVVGKSCDVPHCTSSVILLSHWKECTYSRCSVCIPVTQMLKRIEAQTNLSNQVPSPADSQRIYAHLGFPSHASTSNANINPVIQPSQTIFKPYADVQTSQVPSPTDMQQRCIPLGHQPNVGNRSANNNPVIQPSQDVFNPHEAIPYKYQCSKAWHRLMTEDIRQHLIKKIVQTIFPTVDISVIREERMIPIFEYARKIEDAMYNAADDRDEYCQLLAEKIFRIQKEVEVKREISNFKQQQEVAALGPDFSDDSSVAPTEVLPSWNPLPDRLANGPGYILSSSSMTSPNAIAESQLPNPIKANNQNESYQVQTRLNPPPAVSLQQQQLSQANLDNLHPPMISASASEDSSALPLYSAAIGSKLFPPTESRLSNSINANNQLESYPAQVWPSPPPPVSLQLQLTIQAHFNNMHPPVTTTASASEDSMVLPTYSTAIGSKLSSSSESQLSNSINANNQLESYPAQIWPSPPPPVSLQQQQQLSQAHFNNMHPPVTTTASEDSTVLPTYSTAIGSKLFPSSGFQLSNSINANNHLESYPAQIWPSPPPLTASAPEDSSVLPTYSATIGSKLFPSGFQLSGSIIANNQNEPNLAQIRSSPPPVTSQPQQWFHTHLNDMHPPATTAFVESSDLPTYSSARGSKLFSLLSRPIEANNQSQSNQVWPSPPVSSQQQQFSHAYPGNMNTHVETTTSVLMDSSATPSTLSETPVSRSSSSLQNNYQISDDSETRETAFELVKEDKKDSSEVEGSVSSEDEEILIIL